MRRVKKEIDVACSESLCGRLKRERTICEVIDGFCTYKVPKAAMTPVDGIRDKVREFMVEELYEMCVNKTMKQSSQDIRPTASSADSHDEIYGLNNDVRNATVSTSTYNLSDISKNGQNKISVDLNYKTFLDNLREEKDSYVFQSNAGEGKSRNVKYEGDGKSSGAGLRGVKANKSRVVPKSLKRKRGPKMASKCLKTELHKDGKTGSRRRKIEGRPDSAGVQWVKVSETPRSKRTAAQGEKRPSMVDTSNADRSYKTFWDNLKEDGDSYVVHFKTGEGLSKSIKYEGTGVGLRGVKAKKSRVTRENLKRKNGPKIAVGISKTELHKDDKTVSRRRKPEGLPDSAGVRGVKVSETKRSKIKVSRGEKSPSMVKKTVEPKGNSFRSVERNKSGNDCGSIDISYQEYLSGLLSDGEYPDITPRSCHEVRSEKDRRLRSDSEIMEVASDRSPHLRCKEETECSSDLEGILAIADHPFPDGDDIPFVPSKFFESLDDDATLRSERGRRIGSSWFREKLMEIFCKPFDQDEYNALYRQATVRKPQTRDRELRDGKVFTYEIETLRESYLDRYPDLKTKIICCAGERRKILNLLRGFFYYLTNLAHIGAAFMPWEDKDCLEMMMR